MCRLKERQANIPAKDSWTSAKTNKFVPETENPYPFVSLIRLDELGLESKAAAV